MASGKPGSRLLRRQGGKSITRAVIKTGGLFITVEILGYFSSLFLFLAYIFQICGGRVLLSYSPLNSYQWFCKIKEVYFLLH